MLSSVAYNQNNIFCFDTREKIANNRISMLINRHFERRYNINGIIRRIIEAGLFEKWRSSRKRHHFNQASERSTLSLSFEQMALAFKFILCSGLFISTLTFLCEIVIARKMCERNPARIWVHLERFFDGKRHYLTNLPERLAKSRK